jgi:nicotinamide mononucleotide adenylyltransferase
MDAVSNFYSQHNANTIEEKIKVLEKQMQLFPDNHMEKSKRLMMLERKFNNIISYRPTPTDTKKKWRDAYAQVEQSQSPVSANPLAARLGLTFESEVYNPLDNGRR